VFVQGSQSKSSVETCTYRRLEIDNEDGDAHLYVGHREPWLYTVIQEGDKDWYDFDEGLLTRHSNLMIDYPTGKRL
jgi:hypothetical protein